MFIVKIKKPNETALILELRTENRNLLKPTVVLAGENKLSCEVTEEVKPRVVKIKGID